MAKNDAGLREAFKSHMRGVQIFHQRNPRLFSSMAAANLFQRATPYATIYFSARILDGLAQRMEAKQLWVLIITALTITAFLSLMGAALERYKNLQYKITRKQMGKIYADKMLDMDYVDMDSQYIGDLYSQIRQTDQWFGWGLRKVLEITEHMLEAICTILGGLWLSVSLFLSDVPETAGGFVILNSPVFMMLLLVIMVGAAMLSGFLSSHAQRYWNICSEDALIGNRMFSAYGFFAYGRNRSLDVRMYEQHKISDYYIKRCNSFGTESRIAKYARGPMGYYMVASSAVSVAMTGIVYLFVCTKAWAGAFGIGAVTQYIGAINGFFKGISLAFMYMGDIKANAPYLGTVYEFLDVPNRMYQGSLTTEKRSDRQYDVEFRDVSFRYPGTQAWALRHVNMKFQVGKRLAVVGMNGSGKTTFIKLLCRLYDPTEGVILLNGIDIRKYRYDDYINIFSVVFQDFQLPALALGENVAAAHCYDSARVQTCLEKAGFASRLADMEKGLDTYLYKNLDREGIEISGGEAQKIALARTLYKDAPFIILDEPTAALDPVAEAEVYSGFNEILGDKTAIYISHRLSSCKFCDDILVFHEGAVIQHGTHEKLVSQENGKYYELWNAQAQYYQKKS